MISTFAKWWGPKHPWTPKRCLFWCYFFVGCSVSNSKIQSCINRISHKLKDANFKRSILGICQATNIQISVMGMSYLSKSVRKSITYSELLCYVPNIYWTKYEMILFLSFASHTNTHPPKPGRCRSQIKRSHSYSHVQVGLISS